LSTHIRPGSSRVIYTSRTCLSAVLLTRPVYSGISAVQINITLLVGSHYILPWSCIIIFNGPLIFRTAKRPPPAKSISKVGSWVKHEKMTQTFPASLSDFYRSTKCEISSQFSTQEACEAPVNCGRDGRSI